MITVLHGGGVSLSLFLEMPILGLAFKIAGMEDAKALTFSPAQVRR